MQRRLLKNLTYVLASDKTLARAYRVETSKKLSSHVKLHRNPDLLIAAHPTRGLDVGAIEYIHKKLIEQRDKGKAVLLLSLELDEILNVTDRVAVIYEGKIVAIVDAKETNEQQLGLLMAGGTEKEKVNTNG